MGRGYELATAYVTLAAESSSIPKQIGEAFAKGDKIALSAGQSMGKAVSKGYSAQKGPDFDKLAADAKKADDQVAASAERAAKSRETSSRKVEIAELKVQEVRERSIRQDAEVKNAEKALSDARKSGDTDRVVAAEKGLEDARERVKPTSADLAAEDRLAAARDAQKLSTQKAEAELGGYRQAQEKANAALDEAKRSADSAEGATERAGNAFSQMGGRVKAALKGDFKGAFKPAEREGENAAEEIERDFKRSGDDSAKGFSASFKAGFAGALGGLGAYVGIQEVFDWGKYAVSGAADLEQSIGGVSTVFQGSADQMLKWSQAADQSIGLTENEYNEFAATLGASLKNAGTPIDELGGKTNDLITMGADLASLYGGTTAEAVDALGSALRGEMDPIERYGISLNDAALTAEGLAMGIEKTGGSFTNQQKQLITMSLLQKQSADATGNFAREQDTASNVAQRLSARLKETATQIGSKLTPILADLGTWFLDTGIPALETFGLGIQSAWKILTQGDFDGNLFGLEEDSAAVGFLFNLRDAGIGLWEDALKPLGAWVADHWKDIAAFFAGFAGTAVIAGLITLGSAIGGLIASIAWIPLAIGAAVGALTWFFTQTEVGKAILAAVVDWMVNTAWPAIKQFCEWIAAAGVWLWQTVMKPVWEGIQAAIGAVVGWLVNTAWPLIKGVWDAIAAAAQWLWQSVIQPVWDGIRIAIAIAVTAITVYIDLMKWYFSNVIAPVAMWLWHNVMKPVWNGIKSAIGAVVTWFRDTAWPIFSSVIGWIRAKFEQLKLGLQIIWRFIKNNVIAPVVNWFQNTVWPILSTVIGWIRNKFEQLKLGLQIIWRFIKNNVIAPVVNWFRDTVWPILSTVIGWIRNKFEQLKLALQIIWRFIRNNVIAPFVNWFRDHVWPLISRIIGYIKAGFNAMRDAIKAAWGYVKDKAIAPVVNWFSDTVKPKIDKFTGNVKDAFNSLKESVLKAWGAIESGMKKPINGVINIYNKHIAGNFNKVADTLDLADKYRLEEMAGFATGGYTGPGSKYKEAGIVHADEYVIRKESQRGIERSAPGFLDALNRHGSRALGYASGGLVKLRMPFAGSYPRGDGFGARGGKHKGIDWPIPAGTALKAVAAGTARRTPNATAGNKLELSIGNGLTAGYHHMSRYAVASGASVGRGADIGYVGSTGRSSGPHLHFSLKRDGKYVDPAPYLGAGGSAGSGDGGGWWNPFTNLWSSIKDEVSSAVGDTPVGGIVSKVAENTISGIGAWVTDKITAIGDVVGDVADTTGGYARWSPVASAALALEGEMGPRNLRSLMRRMKQESGYNPRAINNWDSNASRGTPSKGLMQVIDPTFRAYARPGYDKDIWDPMSNILASIRYTRARYGDVRKGWDRKGGYSDGGLVGAKLYDQGGWLEPGEVGVNQSSRPEPVFTGAQWDVLSSAAFSEQSVIGSQPRIHIEHAGLQPADVVDEMEKREHQRRALQVKVRS